MDGTMNKAQTELLQFYEKGADSFTPVTESYRDQLQFKSHYNRQKNLDDNQLERNALEIISQLIDRDIIEPATFEENLDFILDEFPFHGKGLDAALDAKMYQLLCDLEDSEFNWENLTEENSSIFVNSGKLFRKATNSLQRAKQRKYYKANKERIKKRKRLLNARISSRSEKRKRDAKRQRTGNVRKNHIRKNVNSSTLYGDIETTSFYPSAGLVRRQKRKYKDYKIGD